MDKLLKQAIEEYKKLIDYRGSEWGIINPLGMESLIRKWLSKAFKAGVGEGMKEKRGIKWEGTIGGNPNNPFPLKRK